MEAWHSKIQCLLGVHNPTIFKFVKWLMRSQKLLDLEIEQLLAARPQRAKRTVYVAHDARILTIVTDYANRQVMYYLRGLSLNIRH